MNIENLNKPLVARYYVEGINDELELKMAGEILVKLYNITCRHMNDLGGIELFNSLWKKSHGDDYDQDEYIRAYERYFKQTADYYAELARSPEGIALKLREEEPVLLNFNEGYCEIFGYVDRL